MDIELAATYAEFAELIGIENTKKIYDAFRGQQVSFPQRLYDTDSVTAYVKEHYDGTNLRSLAIKFGYSERRIRQFLHAGEEKK